MGLIFWIDQNTFASNLIEKVMKKKNIDFYSITSLNDFVYLIEDLKPAVIVLDGKTALGNLEAFRAEFLGSNILQSIPFVMIDDSVELGFVKKIGDLKKPLDPFRVPEQLEKILGTFKES